STGTATVTLSKAGGIAASDLATVVNGIAYQDTNVDQPSSGTRTVTLTQLVDNGSKNPPHDNTPTLTLASPLNSWTGNNEPELATTTSAQTFTEGSGHTQAAAVTLFSGTTISTIEAGQNITSLTFTVSGLLDNADEKVRVDGTTFSLTNGTTGTTTGGNSLVYNVSVSTGTATVTLSKA